MYTRVKAELLTIGDELLYGQVLDTNSQWMGVELGKRGIQVVRKTSLGDVREEILQALQDATRRADVVLITGGLGPTKDDITKKTLAEFFNSGLVFHAEAYDALEKFFRSRGKEVSETNKSQAVLPSNAIYLPNTCGTAPGMWFEENGVVVVSMPGVPFEMKELMLREVLPRIQKQKKLPVLIHKIIRTVGVGESVLSDILEPWETALPDNMKLAYLPSIGEVKLRLTCHGDDLETLQQDARRQLQNMLTLVKPYVFAYSEKPMEQALGELLVQRGVTVSTAESCSGGYLAHLFTSVAGSSQYFKGSIVAYHNDVKRSMLQVPDSDIQQYGAVSEAVVRQMALQVRQRLNTDIGLASTGIAGPGGGTEEKPVGTVWVALAHEHGVVSRKLQLTARRDLNIRLTAVNLLNLLRQELNVEISEEELWSGTGLD
ncbi:MAG: competence/damage-inducible protein A [Cytophagaceae bacterium]|nr:competence/damage-inducible protein A [Cytophagaceae bacterium]